MSRGLGKVQHQILDVLSQSQGCLVEIAQLLALVEGLIEPERYAHYMKQPFGCISREDELHVAQRAHDPLGRKARYVCRAVQRLKHRGWLETRSLMSEHEQRHGGASHVKAVRLAPGKRYVQDERTS